MARRIRIAVSVFFAVLTVALCVMWVRSFWWRDHVKLASSGDFVESQSGDLTAVLSGVPDQWDWLEIQIPEVPKVWPSPFPTWELTFDYDVTARFPHWFPALVATCFVALPWLTFARFSLRSLLIATTFVAIVLGLGVWLAH